MQQLQIYAGYARVPHLTEELTEIRAALMPHPSLREQAATGTGLAYAIAEIDVLAEAHAAETAQLLPKLPADAHIEGAGIELIQGPRLSPPFRRRAASSNAACGEEGGHGVADCLLQGGKIWVCAVGTSKGVGWLVFELLLYGSEIARR